jgi:hypothetical protein
MCHARDERYSGENARIEKTKGPHPEGAELIEEY